jgi:hypothetical protein
MCLGRILMMLGGFKVCVFCHIRSPCPELPFWKPSLHIYDSKVTSCGLFRIAHTAQLIEHKVDVKHEQRDAFPRNRRHHEKTLGVEEGGSWCGGEGRTDRRERPGKRHRSLRSAAGDCRFLPAKLWAYNLYHDCQKCGVLLMYVDLRKPALRLPLVPTGSLIKTGSKFGHELIAGPLVGNQQVVLPKEPGVGTHVEPIDSAAQRYPFTEVQAPVNDYHAALSLWRMEQQLGDPWAALDNCQHSARKAYYGVPDSPAVTGLAVGAGCLFLLWLAGRN